MSMPRHVAIIMDGNGRWAASRGMALRVQLDEVDPTLRGPPFAAGARAEET